MIGKGRKRKLTLEIDGMSCEHCVRAVEKALSELDGIDRCSVSIGSAKIRFRQEQVDREKIEKAIENAGYTVKK